MDYAALTGALRPAVARHLLASDEDGYLITHQLYCEAALADVLAGERAAAHRRYAEAIEADPGACPPGTAAARLANHWHGARDYDRALLAAWRAACDAGAAAAYPLRLRMLEHVLSLWDRVDDAPAKTGTDLAGLLELAADAARWAGEPPRALTYSQRAMSIEDADRDPDRHAALLRRRAAASRDLLSPGAGEMASLRAALHLASRPTTERARVLAQLGWALRRADEHTEAGQRARELARLAGQLADPALQAEAALLLAAVGAHRGADTIAGVRAALDKAASLGAAQLELWAYLTAGHVLADFGSHELAITWGREGLARACQLGLGRQMAAPIAGNLAESLTCAGRWDEALEVLAEILSLDLPPLGRVHALLASGQIAVLRGDTEAASRALAEVRSLPAGLHAESHYALPLAGLAIDVPLASGKLAAALHAAAGLPAQSGEGNPWLQWALLTTAMRACADAAEAGLTGAPPAMPDHAALRRSLRRGAAGLARRNPRHDAYALTFAAEAARAGGHHDPAAWDAASAAWDSLTEPYPAAYCLLHAARALLADATATGMPAGPPGLSPGSAPLGAARRGRPPRRDDAAGRLRRAAELAGPLGARPLLARVSRVARQARVDLPLAAQAVPGPSRFGLTDRELEVLRLVTAGRNNRDIAAELFISPKTASVHVSNILAKLRVSSRVAAAAVAHREHLFDA
jgi:DNA-binding CsgD family transcriptional regulator